MSGEPQASAPTCEGCGAPLPLDLLNPSLRCRHCGAQVSVDERLRARMRRHVGDASRAVRDEVQARWVGRFYEQNERAARPVILGAVGSAVVFVLAPFVLAIGGVDGGLPLAYAVALVASWAGSIGAFARGWRVMFAVPTPEQLASVRVARCAGCGAASSFGATEAAVRCKHCGSTLLVPSDLAASLLREASEQASRSSAAEATALQRATRAGDRLVVPSLVLVFGSMVAAIGAAVVVGRQAGPAVPVEALVLLMVLAFVAAVVRMAQATLAMMQARRALDASMQRLSARIAEAGRG